MGRTRIDGGTPARGTTTAFTTRSKENSSLTSTSRAATPVARNTLETSHAAAFPLSQPARTTGAATVPTRDGGMTEVSRQRGGASRTPQQQLIFTPVSFPSAPTPPPARTTRPARSAGPAIVPTRDGGATFLHDRINRTPASTVYRPATSAYFGSNVHAFAAGGTRHNTHTTTVINNSTNRTISANSLESSHESSLNCFSLVSIVTGVAMLIIGLALLPIPEIALPLIFTGVLITTLSASCLFSAEWIC